MHSAVLWYWYIKEENKASGGSSSPENMETTKETAQACTEHHFIFRK